MVEPVYVYGAVVRSVYDADTIRADIDLGCGVWLRNEPLRLFGINAPEVRGEEREQGLVSRDWLRTRLANEGQRIVIETIKDKKGKYGRYLARVWAGDVCINEELVERGYAERKEY